ncbi:uncharacterized protein PRCAT00004361001 [Priceomyces carsonii]|uniref:uncharacterized protein n=1 Tax=Priceomyces carsonii TaxID=28549 RepID=UPI002ED9E46B|nr:unnamed protein product [Priceomyces carsonii]
MATAIHPQTDGQTERMNATLNRMLRTLGQEELHNWDSRLAMMEFAYNNSIQKSIKTTPFYADLGRHPKGIHSILANGSLTHNEDWIKSQKAICLRTQDYITDAQKENEIQTNRHRRAEHFELGEWILIHRKAYFETVRYAKLTPVYFGPFRVVKQINENAYEVDLPSTTKKHRVINIEYLKRYHSGDERYPKTPPRTQAEFKARAEEVIALCGKLERTKEIVLMFLDCPPGLAGIYPENYMRHLHPTRRAILEARLKNMTENRDGSQ